MPIYQLRCPVCGEVELFKQHFESVESAQCPRCHRLAARDWSEPKGFQPFRSYWTDHLPSDASHQHVFVDSRETERELCRKANCVRKQ